MSNLETTYYKDVIHIPNTTFKELGCDTSFYFEKEFLDAFAKANPTIEHRYLVLSFNKKPLALVIMQQLSVALDSASETLSIQNRVARSLTCYLNNKKVDIAVCGNLFLSGNFGVFIKEGKEPSSVYEHIAQEMKPLQTQKKASIFFLKDFRNEILSNLRGVQDHQFQAFQVEPNMRLKIEWENFEAYKNALRSKYRVKVNKADEKSRRLTVKTFEAADIKKHKSILQELYCNITDRAMFKTIDMNMETYVFLKERFRESVIFNTYWHNDTIVGFASAFIVNKKLDAHFVGLDYKVNKELSIYPRILNDYVRLGFDLDCDEVNFGRTSSEIKSSLGAQAEDLTCYVRHRRTVANLLFKPLIRQIKMTEYKQHRPFKK